MSEDTQQTTPQNQSGHYDKDKQECEPTPPPPCPDPCDNKPPYGPPEIRPECCTHNPCCPEDEMHCCTWDSVEDPCVKAASAACGHKWTKIDCKCESSNKECDCEEWDCGCYPQGTCVPCLPCEKLIPDPKNPDGECKDPVTGDCTSDNLRKQLEALDQCISSQQSAKARLEADIKARAERADALKDLIKSFDDIVKKYKEQKYKLICKEDCLKGFHRDISSVFARYPTAHLQELTTAINFELCNQELEKCCQKNLEGKLTKVTKLIWEQQEAEKEMKKADRAFAIIKDLPKWIEDRFKELEAIKDEIDKALNDPDPEKYKWAFYLFYWKFAPGLCKCFPFPFCCDKKNPADPNEKPAHLGCKRADWHPSEIDEDRLKALICCAWDYARKQKQNYQDASDKVADTKSNLDFIKKKVEADAKTLDDRIKSGLDKVLKPAPAGR